MAVETLNVTCPGCKNVLVVDRKTGKVLETRKPLVEDTTGDRFEDAKRLVETSQERIEAKAEAARKAQSEKLAKLDSLFKERKKEIEDGGEEIERPDDIFRD